MNILYMKIKIFLTQKLNQAAALSAGDTNEN